MARCRYCRQTYERKRMTQKCCESVDCAILAGQARKAKEAAKQAKAERAAIRVRKEKIKSISDIAGEVQVVFNQFIRARDIAAGHGCISCGTRANVQYAAGHYRSLGASSLLRYNEDNVFLQCNKNCNGSKSGNSIEMRKGMVARIGVARVEAVENANETHKWTRDELYALKTQYLAKLKELKANE